MLSVFGSDLIAFYKDWPMGHNWFREGGLLREDDCGCVYGIERGKTYQLEEALGDIQWRGAGDAPLYVAIGGVPVRVQHPTDEWVFDIDALFLAWRAAKGPILAESIRRAMWVLHGSYVDGVQRDETWIGIAKCHHVDGALMVFRSAYDAEAYVKDNVSSMGNSWAAWPIETSLPKGGASKP